MSYILEALKKSQQERELGRVPTLGAAGVFEEDKVEPPRPPWALVAVGLAAAAVLIALYAALRGPAALAPGGSPVLPLVQAATVLAEPQAPPRAEGPAPAPAAPRQAEPPALHLEDLDSLGVGRRPAVPAPEPADPLPPPVPQSVRPVPVPVQTQGPPLPRVPLVEPPPLRGPLVEPPPIRAPAVEPPPPRRAARPGPPPGGIPYDADSGPPLIHPDLGQGGNPQAELELQRQLEAEFGASGEAEAPAEPVPTPVPKDLIDDIESFKHTLRQGGDEPPKRAAKPQAEQDPTKLRLTAEQQAELPPFLMTVHVFDQDAAKRFVVINGQKYREGDKTREGLKVERILADGAVLGFRSGSFYQHR